MASLNVKADTPSGILDQYYDESHANTWVEIGDGGHAWRGQAFTVGIGGQLKTVGLFVSYNRGSASDIIVEIRNVDTNGLPSGAGISYGTIASFSDTSYTWKYCIFSNPITVTKGTKLAMIFHADSATYWWKIESVYAGGNPSYPGGTYIASQDGDSTWTKGDTNGDTIFRTYIVTSSATEGGTDNVMLLMLVLMVVIIALLIVVFIMIKKKKQGPSSTPASEEKTT